MQKLSLALASVLALTSATAEADDIQIAVAGPFTGSNAASGEQFKRGAEQAVADINAKGGILGKKLVLTVGDDACDPKQAVAVANQLASKGVVFVDGHYCSGSTADSDEAGHAFQSEAGHLFRREAGRGSDLKPATLGVVPLGQVG